jgi:hypothetical protein
MTTITAKFRQQTKKKAISIEWNLFQVGSHAFLGNGEERFELNRLKRVGALECRFHNLHSKKKRLVKIITIIILLWFKTLINYLFHLWLWQCFQHLSYMKKQNVNIKQNVQLEQKNRR